MTDRMPPPIDVTYEEPGGYFDKDEQGWCAPRVTITQDGARVRIRRWFDANGIVRSDSTEDGIIAESDDQRVTIVLSSGARLVFDRALQRLS